MAETRNGSHDGPGRGPVAGHDDIPIWPDTQVDVPSPNLIKYRITDSAGDAVRYYLAEMPEHDWLVGQNPLIRTDLAVLSYVKDGKRATIIIHQDERVRTRVMITIARLAG